MKKYHSPSPLSINKTIINKTITANNYTSPLLLCFRPGSDNLVFVDTHLEAASHERVSVPLEWRFLVIQ